MSTVNNSRRVLDLESRILSALCSAPIMRTEVREAAVREEDDTRTRVAILTALQRHQWQDPEHRVVFEALTFLPGRNTKELREQLPAQATRMGFPDVDWDEYFSPRAAESPVASLVAELLAARPFGNA
jgi:hypothetical protein